MKSNLLLLFIFLGSLLSAQTFTEVTPSPPFDAVYRSFSTFSDVDGDNDQDVLITGINTSGDRIAKLYTNDGNGNFTEVMGTPFDGVYQSSIVFSDVDGDNDEDVLIAGRNGSNTPITKLYTNDEMGNFTEVMGTPFEGVWSGSIAFSDVDGDNDEDVLITGRNASNVLIAKLYTNDGTGNFTEVMGTLFDGVKDSSIAFSDVDGDNDEDVLLTGESSSDVPITKLYTNDGAGNFTEVMSTPFVAIEESSIAFSDVDGDDDEDVLLTGENSSGVPTTKLYANDGGGSFTEVIGTPFDGVDGGSVVFSDVDGDNDQDVLIAGYNGTTPITRLYTNDGVGNFTEVMGTPFDGMWLGTLAFSDVDGDNDQDVLITGESSSNDRIAKLYTNNSTISSLKDLANDLSFEFMLYPNPTKPNQINVSYDSKENGLVYVKIFDLNGKLLNAYQEYVGIGKQTFLINISSLNKGCYHIQLDNGLIKGVQKIVIQE